MDKREEISKFFEDEICDAAKEDEVKIQAQIDQITKETKEKVEQDAQALVKQYEKVHKEAFKKEAALKRAELKNKYFEQFVKLRNDVSNEVFDEVVKELEVYTTTKEYEAYFKEVLDKEYKKGVHQICVRKQDEAFVKTLVDAGDVIVVDDILLGGFRLKEEERNRMIDHTMDALFLEQKQWFYGNSGLVIE